MNFFLIIVISYLIGSFSSAYFVGKYFKKIDIRNHGSGNAGATNALRIMGKKLGVITFLLDFFKGIIAVNIGILISGYDGGLVAAIFTVIGHNYPIFLNFKGGKGIATTIATLAVLEFPITLISVIVGVLVAAISKYVSLGSLVFLSTLFVLSIFGTEEFYIYKTLTILFLMILGYYRHKENIKRLISGTENRLGR